MDMIDQKFANLGVLLSMGWEILIDQLSRKSSIFQVP